MKNFLSLFFCFCMVVELSAQIRLDVEGDAEITGKIGIGTVPANERLTIAGNIEFNDGSGNFFQGSLFNVDFVAGADDLRFSGRSDALSDDLAISSDGFVAIGKFPTKEAKLAVINTGKSLIGGTAAQFNSESRGIASFVSNSGAVETVIGIQSVASGGGTSYGGSFDGSGSSSLDNYGVYGRGDNSGSGKAYGLYGEVSGTSTRYAIYGFDNGVGGTSYAGYFDGKVAITDLPIGGVDYVMVDANGNLFRSSPGTIIEEQENKNSALKEAIAIQQQEMEKLKSLENKVAELSTLVEKLLSQEAKTSKNTSYLLPLEQKARLEQNQPNPFLQNTLVDYFIPMDVQQAYIQVTSQDGKVLGKVQITEMGKGQVNIQSKNYPTGTYFYSLVLDGQALETKRMVLTQ